MSDDSRHKIHVTNFLGVFCACEARIHVITDQTYSHMTGLPMRISDGGV